MITAHIRSTFEAVPPLLECCGVGAEAYLIGVAGHSYLNWAMKSSMGMAGKV